MAKPRGARHGSGVNFALLARFHSPLPVEALRDALDRLKGRHLSFDMGDLRGGLPGSHPPETKAYPLRVLSNCADEDWQEVAAGELAQAFPPHDPRVRFVLLERELSADLLVVCDHSVSDGLSGVVLLRDLLELLNLPEKHLPPLPVPPPVWEVLPCSVLRSIQNRLRMAVLVRLLDLWEWNRKRRKTVRPPLLFQVNSAELSIGMTPALVKRCRIEQTSVHAAICAAWLLALDILDGDTAAVHPKKKGSTRSVSSPVNLRKWLTPEMRESAGLFYTTVETRVRCDRSLWDIARDIKQKMSHAEQTAAFHTTPLFLQSMYKRMTGLPEGAVFHMPEPPVSYDYSMTNLGRVESSYDFSSPQDAHYSIDALYGPIVNAFRGEKTVGACTLGGQLRFVLTTFSEEMNLNKAKELTRGAMMILEKAVQPHATL